MYRRDIFSPTFPKMPNAVYLTYSVVLWIETVLICIGNAFTIFVFWNQKRYLKRACYFLLNLAVADFLVGATGLINNAIGTMMIFYGDVSHSVAVLFSSISLLSLLVISLERACAVIWPFRHRVAGTCVYVTTIIIVWVVGLCVAMVNVLANYNIVRQLHTFLFTTCTLFFCLFVVLMTYMAIRTRLKTAVPACAVETRSRRLLEQNIKLSKTMFVVIGLSFGFWLPGITVYTVLALCDHCFPGTTYEHPFSIATVLYLANSLVNPIVYTYRMPMFKVAMKKLLIKGRCRI